jgi:hypothetical protein
MRFVVPRPLADPDVAARKLVENANGVEAVQDGRIFIEKVNAPFLAAGGSEEDFRAGIARAIALAWLWRHEPGTYVKFTLERRRLSTRMNHPSSYRKLSSQHRLLPKVHSALHYPLPEFVSPTKRRI